MAGEALAPSPMGPHNAVGVDGGTVARVNTLLGAAGQHLRAVIIHDALWLAAALVGVAQVAGRTQATGLVVPWLAHRLNAALLVDARVLALALDAGLGQGTFKVALTTRLYACCVRISL